MKPIVTICGWCPDKDERTKEEVSKGNQVSHTICDECMKVQEEAMMALETPNLAKRARILNNK